MIEVTHPPTQGLLVLERKRQNALGKVRSNANLFLLHEFDHARYKVLRTNENFFVFFSLFI